MSGTTEKHLGRSLRLALMLAALAASTAAIGPAPAFARDASATVARSFNGALYYGFGNRVCGKVCGVAAKRLGNGAFDTGERFTKWYGDKTSSAGKAIRRLFTDN